MDQFVIIVGGLLLPGGLVEIEMCSVWKQSKRG